MSSGVWLALIKNAIPAPGRHRRCTATHRIPLRSNDSRTVGTADDGNGTVCIGHRPPSGTGNPHSLLRERNNATNSRTTFRRRSPSDPSTANAIDNAA